MRFPAGTCLGADKLPPRVIGHASEKARSAYASLLNRAERCVAWPSQVSLL